MRQMRFWGLILCGLFLAVSGCQAADLKIPDSGERKIITPNQHFILKDLQGRSVNLDGLLATHKAVLVNFTATWCPYCREEIPGLIKIQEDNRSKSFTILAVDIDESPAKVSAFSEKMGVNYPVVIDVGGEAAQQYGVRGIPMTILLRSDGAVLGVYHNISDKLLQDIQQAIA